MFVLLALLILMSEISAKMKSDAKNIDEKPGKNTSFTDDGKMETYYNTVESQKSMLSVDSIVEAFPHGEIEFTDGIQRHKRVCSKYTSFKFKNCEMLKKEKLTRAYTYGCQLQLKSRTWSDLWPSNGYERTQK
jgi:hypothetical protein